MLESFICVFSQKIEKQSLVYGDLISDGIGEKRLMQVLWYRLIRKVLKHGSISPHALIPLTSSGKFINIYRKISIIFMCFYVCYISVELFSGVF